MQIHEQIYTSAAELLEGGGNLGVVAKTRGFPSELAPDLASLRSYTMLSTLPIDQPDKHPARFVGGPRLGGTLYSFSRIAFGGFDHTGRTTPLAHHLVAMLSDMERDEITPAELLASSDPMFVRRYTPPPRWIDPPRQIEALRDSDPESAIKNLLALVSPALVGLIPRIANAVFAFAATRRPAIVVVDSTVDAGPLFLLRAVLSILPTTVQRSTTWATHVVETTDYVRDAAIVFTYSGTPFLEQCQFRRDGRAPIIFGTGAALGDTDVSSANIWTAIIGTDWPDNIDRVIEACRRWDQFVMQPADMERFGRAVSLVTALEAATPDQVGALGQKLSVASSPPAIVEWVAECAERTVQRWAGDSAALVATAGEPKWPLNSRAAAIDRILERAKRSSDSLNQLSNRARSSSELMKVIASRIVLRPEVITIAFNRAALTNVKEDIDAVDFLLTAGSLDMFMALEFAERAASFSTDRQRLSGILIKAISGAADSLQRMEMLLNAGETETERRFSRSITLPVLRGRLQTVSDSFQWSAAYGDFSRVSLQVNAVAEQAHWLFQTFRKNLSAQHVDQWLSIPGIGEAEGAIIRREAKNVGIDLTEHVDLLEIADDQYGKTDSTAIGNRTRTSNGRGHFIADTNELSGDNDNVYGRRNAFTNRPMPIVQGGSTAGLIWWTNILLALIAIAGVIVGLIPEIRGNFPHLQILRPPRKSLAVGAIVGGILFVWMLSGPLIAIAMKISGKQRIATWIPLIVPFVLLAAVAIAWWSI